MNLLTSAKEYQLYKAHLLSMPLAKNILMVEPTYFNVEYGINPHMYNREGALNQIDFEKAQNQWRALKKTYEDLGFHVFVQKGIPHLPDMVFCANQTFPVLGDDQKKYVILSNMKSDIRNKEVPYISQFFEEHGYKTETLAKRNEDHFFESMGDALWFPGKKFILGGYGIRTSLPMYKLLTQKTGAPVSVFHLEHPKFYHLDTCLSILDAQTALYCEEAFDTAGLDLLSSIFSNLIKVSLAEADSPGFACNAHSPDQKYVILGSKVPKTYEMLVQNGFIPIEVDTSEFIKAGGSVFCMKLMFF